MFYTLVTKYIRSILNPTARWEKSLLSSETLDSRLRKERIRSDRTREAFSFLKYSPREQTSTDATMKALVKILRDRLRLTDEIGLLERKCVGVILPNTPSEGAVKVADDILLLFPADLTPPQCEIFTYQYKWPNKHSAANLDEEKLSNESFVVKPMDVLFAQTFESDAQVFS